MRWVPRTPAELEQQTERATGMYRTTGPFVSPAEAEHQTRKRLGPLWGRKRTKRKTP